MIIINNRDELVNFLYNGSNEYDTLVGVARIGGDLLVEAVNNGMMIEYFFYAGDEGEYIMVDRDGTIMKDSIYY